MAVIGRLLVVMWLAIPTVAVGESAKADALASGARDLVTEIADSAILELTDSAVTRDERKDRMRSMMHRYFHVEGIAQWVLGRHWRSATDAQRAEYLDVYEDLMIETYVDRFDGYQGEDLDIVDVDVRNGKDAIVKTMIARPGAVEGVQVDWRVRAYGERYMVIDIMVEGVSMGQAQRSEFSAAIGSVGGDLQAFFVTLRERVASLQAGGAG